jgi:hypothetical protein
MASPIMHSTLIIRSLSGGAVFLGPWEGIKPGDNVIVKLDGFGFGKWFVFSSQQQRQGRQNKSIPESLRLPGGGWGWGWGWGWSYTIVRLETGYCQIGKAFEQKCNQIGCRRSFLCQIHCSSCPWTLSLQQSAALPGVSGRDDGRSYGQQSGADDKALEAGKQHDLQATALLLVEAFMTGLRPGTPRLMQVGLFLYMEGRSNSP